MVFDSNKVTENYTWDKCATKVEKWRGDILKTRNTSTDRWGVGGRGREQRPRKEVEKKRKKKRNVGGRVGRGGGEKEIELGRDRKTDKEARNT